MTFIPKDQVEEFLAQARVQDEIEQKEVHQNKFENPTYQESNNQGSNLLSSQGNNNQGPNLPPNLPNSTNNNLAVRRPKTSNIFKRYGAFACPVIFGSYYFCLSLFMYQGCLLEKRHEECNLMYTKALAVYADANNDAQISQEEKNNFDRKMCAENNIKIIDGKQISNDTGLELTIKDQIKLLEKYQN